MLINSRPSFILALLTLPVVGFGQQRPTAPLQEFPLSAVKLLDSPFLAAQQTDKAYIMALDPERLLAPFLIDAGLPNKAERYPNW